MKKLISTIGLLSVLSTSAAFAACSDCEEKTSLSPRDWSPSLIPSQIAQLILTRLNKLEFATVVSEMQAEGVEESVVVAQVNAEGALVHAFRDSRSLNESLEDHEQYFIPFKVSISSDGSYDVKVALYEFKDNENYEFDQFAGWLSVDNFKFLETGTKNDKTRGLKTTENIFAELNIKMGIMQSEDLEHNLYLTLGATGFLDSEYQTYDQDGYKYSINGNGSEYRAGLKYTYGKNEEGRFEMSAGYAVKTTDGKTSTQGDQIRFSNQMSMYNDLLDQYNQDEAAYQIAKADFANLYGWDVEDVSDATFQDIMGVVRPSFNEELPEFERSKVVRKTNSIYGKMSYSKYLPSRNIRIGFSVDGRYNLNDEMTGSDQTVIMGDKYNVGAGFNVEW